LEHEVSTVRGSGWVKDSLLSPAKAGLGFVGDMIPGLRSLRSLTRGYYHAAAPRLVDPNIHIDSGRVGIINIGRNPTKSLDASGGSVFCIMTGPAMRS